MRSSVWSWMAAALAAAGLVGWCGLGAAPTALAATASSSQHVHPDASVSFAGMQCRVGMVLHKHKTVYVAIPASCGGLPADEGHAQNGCQAANAPVGAPVKIAGARKHGTLVYDSFTEMQDHKIKRNHNQCWYDDFALVRLSHSDGKRASGRIPGTDPAPEGVDSTPPSGGSDMTLGGSQTVKSDGNIDNNWVYRLSGASALTASDVGTPLVRSGKLEGMLTVIPDGLIMKNPPAVYNLHRALKQLHSIKKWRHVKVLKVGQHP